MSPPGESPFRMHMVKKKKKNCRREGRCFWEAVDRCRTIFVQAGPLPEIGKEAGGVRPREGGDTDSTRWKKVIFFFWPEAGREVGSIRPRFAKLSRLRRKLPRFRLSGQADFFSLPAPPSPAVENTKGSGVPAASTEFLRLGRFPEKNAPRMPCAHENPLSALWRCRTTRSR